MLSRAAQVSPGDKSLWKTPIYKYDKDIAENVMKYLHTIQNYQDIRPMEKHLMKDPNELEEICVFSDGSLSFSGYMIHIEVDQNREQDTKFKCRSV